MLKIIHINFMQNIMENECAIEILNLRREKCECRGNLLFCETIAGNLLGMNFVILE